jgi:hypothetical protein
MCRAVGISYFVLCASNLSPIFLSVLMNVVKLQGRYFTCISSIRPVFKCVLVTQRIMQCVRKVAVHLGYGM